MDMVARFMTWILVLRDLIFRIFTRTIVVDLPPDIMMDIFSRLPAELVFQCCQLSCSYLALTSSQFFIDLHLNRATSVIVIPCDPSYQTGCYSNDLYENTVPLYFVNDRTKKVVRKCMQVSFSCRGLVDLSFLFLFDSYKGLLLFENGDIFVIWNPITEEQVIVNRTAFGRVCGFFFDHKTKEYKVLFLDTVKRSYIFIIYSLGTRSYRKTTKLLHAPWIKAPVELNGALHWIVYDGRCQFSESIVLFDTDSENTNTMARPGHKYRRCRYNSKVHLMNWGGLLTLFDSSSHTDMEIWVLEDYAQEVWIKKLCVSLEFVGRLPKSRDYFVHPINMDTDEVLVNSEEAIFAYNLKMNTSRKLKLRGVHGRVNLHYSVIHTSTFVSVNTDESC